MSGESGAAKREHLFGSYHLMETVGHGGMGVVYRAIEAALERDVALKVLRDDLRSQPHIVARFKREAEAVASLDHPNIVHIYSVGAVGRIPYIAMEYIDGAPLSDIMKRERRIGWEKALEVAEQVATALGAAHEAQIVHRDIKPGNILLDKKGKAYVSDFGIAKVLTAETQLTVDGSSLGTPQYMSPERCKNEVIDASSDLYSLGVVVFQMISGRLPYEANGAVELIRKIMASEPKRLCQFVPDVPPEVEKLVAYMIERRPANRPANADMLVRAIARVRAGKPLDERGADAGSALGAFRESMATPTPMPPRNAMTASTTTLERASSVVRRLGSRYETLPAGLRTALKVGVNVAILALITVAAVLRTRDVAGIDARARDASARERWYATPHVAEFSNENPGVITGALRLADFEVLEGTWWDASTITLQLKGSPDSERAGQWASCEVDVPRRHARLVMPPTYDTPRGMAASAVVPLPHSPDGAYRVQMAEGNDGLLLVHQSDDSVLAHLKTASSFAWHPSGQQLVVTAKDVKGTTQLWLVNVAEPENAKQLTHLSAGTLAMCGVSEDGMRVFSVVAHEEYPVIVAVELDKVG